MPDSPFSLLLTHDVDRPYKTYQSLYYAAVDREPRHLLDLLPGRNPYWQFETVTAIEEEFGVRSAWYFLDEQTVRDRPRREWLRPATWKRYAGRYDVTDPAIADVVRELDDGGWEVGVHGSFESYRDPCLFRAEKRRLERVLGHPVTGGRQHYLNLSVPATWETQAAYGLEYDASLGSATELGFQDGYEPLRPLPDRDFAVFPLTAMEVAFPDPGADYDAAHATMTGLLDEAAREEATMSVLFHPRYFSEREFPGYRGLYRDLVGEALDRGAWVGTPAAYLDRHGLPSPRPSHGTESPPVEGVGGR